MKGDAVNEADDALRRAIYGELDAAMDRLNQAVPDAPAQRSLAIGLAYFADMMARNFGHADTTNILVSMAEHGFAKAAQETTATRN